MPCKGDPMDPWFERMICKMLDLIILIIFVIASTLTYFLVLGCESLMEKRA
jgi:hypothetical protein